VAVRWTCCALLATACALRARPAANAVDELFHSAGRVDTRAPEGTLVSAYRTLFRPLLGTDCRWLPSDSEYFVRSMGACGAVSATYVTFAGLLEEPDISRTTAPFGLYHGRLRWFRGPVRCEP